MLPKTELILRHVFDDAAKARANEMITYAQNVWPTDALLDDAVTNSNNFQFRRSLLGKSIESQDDHDEVMTYLSRLHYGVYP